MELKKLGNNETQVTYPNGLIVLYSYNTPVAVRHFASGIEYKTNKKWSATTSKHINKWVSAKVCKAVSQEQLEKILKEGVSCLSAGAQLDS